MIKKLADFWISFGNQLLKGSIKTKLMNVVDIEVFYSFF